MKLSDLLEPGDEHVKPKNDKVGVKELIRNKAFRSMLKTLTKKNNPAKDMTPELAGDGGHDESPVDDKATTDVL